MIKFLFTISILYSTFCFSQYDVDSTDVNATDSAKVDWFKVKQRIYVGGELSLNFGNQLYLYMAPLAGYEIYKGFSAGVQTMYQLRRAFFTNGSTITSHAFGGGVFARYRPPFFPYVMAQTEFSLYNVENLNTLYNGDRTTIPSVMTGLGYSGGFGRSYFYILLLYDFVDNPSMPLPRFFGNLPLYIRYGMVFYLG